jgi:P4 family phage/plasmid primase-like protien
MANVDLIADHDITLALAQRYMNMGYQPIPIATSGKGKAWITGGKNDGIQFPSPVSGDLISERGMIDHFRSHQGCGIGVIGRYTRDGANDLLFIDADVSGETGAWIIEQIALILGYACPVKVGGKGATFCVRYPNGRPLPDILKERGLPNPKIATGTKIVFPWLAHTKDKFIDLIGAGGKDSHVVMPPTLHKTKTESEGQDHFYHYIPFPGTSTVLKLEDTARADLPEIGQHQLMLLYQLAKNRESPIWNYLGQTGPGNHHHLMLSASTYMYHEGFTQEEIAMICGTEAERSAQDEASLKIRQNELADAVRTLPSKIPEPTPTERAKASREAAPPKAPLERVMTEWLKGKYEKDDLAAFSGVAHYWTDRWAPIMDINAQEPWHDLFNQLYSTFDIATLAPTRAAISSFAVSVPNRAPQPNKAFIPFNNGVLDVTDMTLYVEQRDDYIPARIGYDYDEHAEAPMWVAFLRSLMRPPLEYEDRENYKEEWSKSAQVVEEFLGYCLVRSHAFEKMLFLIGKPGTGKSVLNKVFSRLLPKGWITTVAMDALDEPNSRMLMAMSSVNISAEVGRRSRDVDDVLLKVVSGEDVEVKLLYQNRMNVVLPTRLIFHGNLPPDTTDATGAIERRMLILRTTDLKPDRVNMYENRLLEEAPGILTRLVRAYARLLERGEFEPPEYSLEVARGLSMDSNAAMRWMNECAVRVTDLKEGALSSDLYDHFRLWCDRNGERLMSSMVWGKHMTSIGCPSRLKRTGAAQAIMRYRNIKLLSTVGAGVSY